MATIGIAVVGLVVAVGLLVNGVRSARRVASEVTSVEPGQSGLVTFEAQGERADRLARELAGKPGIEMVAPFGAALHVSGTERAALEKAIAPFRRDPWTWSEVSPTLEDVFIQLMRDHGGQQDNLAA
jgi:ABC-2 type transport system ATP-binding protein